MLLPSVLPAPSRMPRKVGPTYLTKIAIFGAGGLGREVLMLLHQINKALPQWHILGFYDDDPATPKTIQGYPYLGTLTDLLQTKKPLAMVIALGNPVLKAQIRARLDKSVFSFPPIIHPEVSNDDFQINTIGEGTIICQGNILTTNIKLGQHVLLNLGCTVGHDAILGDFCSLMPHVNISGNTVLEKQVYIGTNATLLPGMRVGEKSIIGAGAVVTQPIPDNCTAVGVPARIIKEHAEK